MEFAALFFSVQAARHDSQSALPGAPVVPPRPRRLLRPRLRLRLRPRLGRHQRDETWQARPGEHS